jgi:histidinol-phosphate aminotransferase
VEALSVIEQIHHITPSDANFILAKLIEPRELYNFLVSQGIIVRDRSKVELCEGCLRITVGTAQQNSNLVEAIKQFYI